MPSSKREREVARRRYERRQAQRQYKRSRARRRNAVIGAVLATVLVIGGVVALGVALSGDGKKSTSAAAASTSATPTSTPSAAVAPGTCSYGASQGGSVKNVGKPPTKPDLKTPYIATIKTNVGTIKVDLLTSKAPCTVNSFRYLASKKYFDGTSCHRLTTSGIYVLQCGDPSGTGAGGPGYQFADENLTGATYPAGTVAMANAGPGTNGSQFFLVYKNTTLAPSYTPFGKVVSGLDVVQKIAAAGTATGSGDGAPKSKVTIQSFTVQPA